MADISYERAFTTSYQLVDTFEDPFYHLINLRSSEISTSREFIHINFPSDFHASSHSTSH
jgi:hypothetical protein